MDWSYLDFHLAGSRDRWSTAKLSMPDPRAFGRDQSQPILDGCSSLDELVEAFKDLARQLDPEDTAGQDTFWGWRPAYRSNRRWSYAREQDYYRQNREDYHGT
jgi:hypothetical protein